MISKQPRRAKWYHWSNIQARSPLFRSFDRCLWFRINLALIVAYIGLLFVNRIEHWVAGKALCNVQDTTLSCITRELVSLITVNNIESFGISTVAALYLFESRKRRQHHIYEAWQVVDNATTSGVSSSRARVKALQDLNSAGVSLDGLDISQAYLKQINLTNAKLIEANLQGANLQGSILSHANLSGANLQGADLQGANLYETNFQGANLSGANLEGAYLKHANFQNANLQGAHLKHAYYLHKAKFIQADLSGVDFQGVCLR
ncbi:MAG: pentapeptide repeat-containing protein, partial [Cyanobacteriota bacterium]|nr:pentapeptide repeat-containing protein [Cyanobacteriota bacterium]